jgi:cyclic beta-1,2-glucan synthetase
VESLLGLRLEVDKLYFAPCLPADWKGFTLHYRYRETVYHIVVSQTRAADSATIGETSITVDGVERHDQAIPLVDDRQDHTVEVKTAALPTARPAGFPIVDIPASSDHG